MRDEDRELKMWLRGLLPEGWGREDVADELHVTRKTITNMLSLTSTSFANGRTMLGYLRFVGALVDVPTDSPATSRLATLEARLEESAEATAESLDRIAEAIARLEDQRGGGGGRRRTEPQ